MRHVKRYLIFLPVLILLGGMHCQDNSPAANNPAGPLPGTDSAKLTDPDGGIGYGVSGLLFNNNLVLYDRARSNRALFELVLIPQMYFTNIEDADFPVYGTFPRNQMVSGGVKIDDIAAITDPVMVAPGGVSYVRETDLVIGLSVNGDTRAYPHNVLWWHEIINDKIGGQRVSVTFCPLTGTGLVFDSGTPRDRLQQIPVMETTWARWKQLHPDTRVVAASNSRQTPEGLTRYPYGNYRSDNTEPLFSLNRPADGRFPPKRMVHGVLIDGLPKAYPFSSLGSKSAVNDRFAGVDILVVFDQEGQLALSYDRNVNGRVLTFSVVNSGTPFRLRDEETGSVWTVEGQAIEGELAGQHLTRIQNAYNAFWFAWAAFWPATDVYMP